MPAAGRLDIAAPSAIALRPVRVRGGISATFARDAGRTRVGHLTEQGGYRLALPTTFAAHIEATQINTGGGVAGGDHVTTSLVVGSGADVVFASQGAERIYRSSGDATRLDLSLRLEADARLDWLPQQTIVFAGARLKRRIEVDLHATSRLLMVEVITFGRPASIEPGKAVEVSDAWRIRRDRKLILAEALRLQGDMPSLLDRAAVGGGARSAATLIHVAPDATERLDEARLAIADAACEAGVSAWNGLLAARFLAQDPARAIAAAARLASTLARRAMPRVWAI